MIERALANTLRKSKVRIDEVDPDTVCLRGVPAHPRFFNKPQTNLLIKRPREGLPFVICVDEDLEYTGPDASLTRVFAGSGCRQGWRVLSLPPDAAREEADAIENALDAVGFGEREPALRGSRAPAASAGSALTSFGLSVSALVARGLAEPCIGRTDQIDEALCCLAQHRPRLPLIVSASGVGKTNFLHGVASTLFCSRRSNWEMVVVDLGAAFSGTMFHAERETLLGKLLEQASTAAGTVLGLEHVELLLLEVPHGAHLLAQAQDRGARVIGTAMPEHVKLFALPPLAGRVHNIELVPLVEDDALGALMAHRDRFAIHHGVVIGDAVVRGVMEAAHSLAGPLPAKAIALLDAAAARAGLGGEAEVGMHHLYMAVSRLEVGECS